jgi:hypothetical protein
VRLGGESAPSIEETAVMTKSIVIRGGVNAVLLIEKISSTCRETRRSFVLGTRSNDGR